MTLTIRCQNCRSLHLEIRSGSHGHHADLWCGQCDRFIRHLSKYQARSFERHLPKPETTGPELTPGQQRFFDLEKLEVCGGQPP